MKDWKRISIWNARAASLPGTNCQRWGGIHEEANVTNEQTEFRTEKGTVEMIRKEYRSVRIRDVNAAKGQWRRSDGRS